MDSLNQFINASNELKLLLDGEPGKEEREQVILRIDELLITRQENLDVLSDLSVLDEKLKQELVATEKEILTLMEKQKEHIKQDLKTLQLKKQKNEQYSNPYDNISVDGMFLDKKK